MNPEEQYVLINQNNRYYQEFDDFKGIPRHTNTIHHAWIYPTIDDAKQAIKDIKEWTWSSNNKLKGSDMFCFMNIILVMCLLSHQQIQLQ